MDRWCLRYGSRPTALVVWWWGGSHISRRVMISATSALACLTVSRYPHTLNTNIYLAAMLPSFFEVYSNVVHNYPMN